MFWGWGPAEHTGRGCSRRRSRRRKEEKEKTTNIKSNNPHLTGGEPRPQKPKKTLTGGLKPHLRLYWASFEGCNYGPWSPWSSGNPWNPLKKGNNKQLVWQRNIRISSRKKVRSFCFFPLLGNFTNLRKSFIGSTQLSIKIFQPEKSWRFFQ